MMGTKKPTSLCGFLNVLKPPGMTSARVVSVARRLFQGAKVGHAGTLDPEAAGVLPLMIGKAARLFDYMQDKEKGYVAEVAFGCSTDTQDAQGVVLERSEAYPDEKAIRAALEKLTGEIWQKPPIYSAIKQDGKRLYQLARAGETAETVDIPARRTRIHELILTEMTEGHGALISLKCSKGFYVRTLCHDLGEVLGCPAHMRFLLRTQSGVFTLDTAQTLESLEKAAQEEALEAMLIPPEAALSRLAQAEIPLPLRNAFFNGGKLHWTAFPELQDTSAAQGMPAGFWLDGRLMAIGERRGNEVKLRTWLGE